METAYDLFKKLLVVMADIDRILDEKSKVIDSKRNEILDKKNRFLGIRNVWIKKQIKKH